MRVLITGGAGFVGSHLAEELAKENDVVVFDSFSSGRIEFLGAISAEVVRGDIRDLEQVKKACKEVDSVYHFAADPDMRRSVNEPLENFRIDALGTLNTLETCRLNDVKHVVFASSSVVYGDAKIPTPRRSPYSSRQQLCRGKGGLRMLRQYLFSTLQTKSNYSEICKHHRPKTDPWSVLRFFS